MRGNTKVRKMEHEKTYRRLLEQKEDLEHKIKVLAQVVEILKDNASYGLEDELIEAKAMLKGAEADLRFVMTDIVEEMVALSLESAIEVSQ